MERCREFIGGRCIEAANVYGEGKHLYNMWLTSEEVIRCQDCELAREDGWKCIRWATSRWDEEQAAYVIELADVRPEGFCFEAKRREA